MVLETKKYSVAFMLDCITCVSASMYCSILVLKVDEARDIDGVNEDVNCNEVPDTVESKATE
jgi:hypothetical protein